MPLKVEVGGGRNPRKGYVNCDVRQLDGVDHVCTADDLPFADGEVQEIYTRHVVEHFTLKEFLTVLVEWNRVLKIGGTVYIVCPNLLFHLRQVLDGSHESFYDKAPGRNARYWGFGSLFGWQQDEYDVHKFGYYFELLRDILIDHGFVDVEDLTNSEASLEKAEWHLEVRARKGSSSIGSSESRFRHHFDVSH